MGFHLQGRGEKESIYGSREFFAFTGQGKVFYCLIINVSSGAQSIS
jgi:hypothetical protein